MSQSPLVSTPGPDDFLADEGAEQQGESSIMGQSPLVSARGPDDFEIERAFINSYSDVPDIDSLPGPVDFFAPPGEIEQPFINNSDLGMTFDDPAMDSFPGLDGFLAPPAEIDPPFNNDDFDMTFNDPATLDSFLDGEFGLDVPELRPESLQMPIDPALPQGDRVTASGPESPEIPIDPALLHVDSIMASGPDKVRNMQLAQQFLADMGLWPEP